MTPNNYYYDEEEEIGYSFGHITDCFSCIVVEEIKISLLNNFDYALKRVISQLLRIAVAFISFSILLVNFCSSCSFW